MCQKAAKRPGELFTESGHSAALCEQNEMNEIVPRQALLVANKSGWLAVMLIKSDRPNTAIIDFQCDTAMKQNA